MAKASGLTSRFPSEYNSWKSMRRRCYNPKDPSYRYVGAKGLIVCPRWLLSFAWFLEDMGEKPTPRHSIDRIDNTKGYWPENCRWATPKEQARNRPSYNRLIHFQGEAHCLPEWSEILGINLRTLQKRMQLGWDIQKVLTRNLGKRVRVAPYRPILPKLGHNPNNVTSGQYGVGMHKGTGKWQARITWNKKVIHLGLHATQEAALEAVRSKRAELEGASHA